MPPGWGRQGVGKGPAGTGRLPLGPRTAEEVPRHPVPRVLVLKVVGERPVRKDVDEQQAPRAQPRGHTTEELLVVLHLRVDQVTASALSAAEAFPPLTCSNISMDRTLS